VRKAKKACTNKIIDALKNEIENNDVSKHIDIINVMHQTEITHLNKRFENQNEMKQKQIESLEEDVAGFKSKIKDLENRLHHKNNEFDYYVREESIRMQEFEFKIKSQTEQRNNFLQQISPQSENTLRLEFEEEIDKLKRQNRRQIQELKDEFSDEKYRHEDQMRKTKDTVRRLTDKLSELKEFKDKERSQLLSKLKKPCQRCRDLEQVFEENEAIKMEREDAYQKIE